MYKVGLIGYGAFGKALAGWLAHDCEFVIYDAENHPDDLAEALSQPIIVLAIPAQFLATFLHENQSLLNPRALYIDVCSVKVEPVKIMQTELPSTAAIIATHPAFGPESAKQSVAGQPIMIHAVRADPATYAKFKDFLTKLRLELVETMPEAHDRDMAYVQGLSHYIGRVMQELAIPNSALATRAYHDLLDMKNIQGNDSDDLFTSIVHNNPFAPEVLQKFRRASHKIDDRFQL